MNTVFQPGNLPQASAHPTSSGPDTTATPFVPVPGQSFSSEQDWINRASRALTSHPAYCNTEHGDERGWRGAHFTALCFDQAGNRMRMGADFMRATAQGAYPVWWVWPDQLNELLRAAAKATGAA